MVAGVLLAGGCTVVVRPQEACTTPSTATGGVDVAAAYGRRRQERTKRFGRRGNGCCSERSSAHWTTARPGAPLFQGPPLGAAPAAVSRACMTGPSRSCNDCAQVSEP